MACFWKALWSFQTHRSHHSEACPSLLFITGPIPSFQCLGPTQIQPTFTLCGRAQENPNEDLSVTPCTRRAPTGEGGERVGRNGEQPHPLPSPALPPLPADSKSLCQEGGRGSGSNVERTQPQRASKAKANPGYFMTARSLSLFSHTHLVVLPHCREGLSVLAFMCQWPWPLGPGRRWAVGTASQV